MEEDKQLEPQEQPEDTPLAEPASPDPDTPTPLPFLEAYPDEPEHPEADRRANRAGVRRVCNAHLLSRERDAPQGGPSRPVGLSGNLGADAGVGLVSWGSLPA